MARRGAIRFNPLIKEGPFYWYKENFRSKTPLLLFSPWSFRDAVHMQTPVESLYHIDTT